MELDNDLRSRQQARDLARLAGEAQKILAEYPQEKLDAIAEAVGQAFSKEAVSLAEEAVRAAIRDYYDKNNIPYGDELRECDGHCETCHQEHE